MENLDKFIEFAPIIVVVLGFIWQNNIFVKPEQLEKKHREILEDTEKKFVTWSAFNATFNALKEQMNKIELNVTEIRNHIIEGD